MKKLAIMMVALLVSCVSFGAASTHLAYDCPAGDRLSAGTEQLTFSNLWDGDENATVTIAQNGTPIFTGLKGEGTKTWTVDRNGRYELTHTTYTNGVAGKVETAVFVVEGKEVPQGRYVTRDLVNDLGIEIPRTVDYAAGDKVTVKVEGLAKGLKVVATPVYEDPNAKKKVIADYIYTIEGVPTEPVDFEQQPMFARVTVTYKDKTKTADKTGKAETLQPVPLSIKPAQVRTLKAGILNGIYTPTDIAALWPAVADAKGNPAGVAIYDVDAVEGEKPLATVTAKVGKTTGAISVSFTSKKGDKAKYAVELVWRGDNLFAGHVTRTWKDGKDSCAAYGTVEVK